MTHYLIGDVQGCFDELNSLLNKINFNFGVDTLWLTGDIVNRGPKSLETLKFIKKNENSIRIVLGNHDLHLIRVALGYGKVKKGDTIDDVLKYKDLNKIIDWLRNQKMLINEGRFILVHAGILPSWGIEQAKNFALEVEDAISGEEYNNIFDKMYTNKLQEYSTNFNYIDKIIFIINVMTRIRAISFDNKLNFDYKGTLDTMPKDLQAWFQSKDINWNNNMILFGHWSSIGYYIDNHVICADTGVVWGKKLTAINLSNFETTEVSCSYKFFI